MTVYQEPKRLEPGFTGSRYLVFEGGCIIHEYTFDDGTEPTLVIGVLLLDVGEIGGHHVQARAQHARKCQWKLGFVFEQLLRVLDHGEHHVSRRVRPLREPVRERELLHRRRVARA